MTAKLRKKPLLAVASTLAVLAFVALIWLFNGLADTFRHIRPSGSISASTSMDPFELNLKTRIRGGELIPKGIPPLEWKLDVPQTFVGHLIGENGLVGGGINGDTFIAILRAKVVADESTLVPPLMQQNQSARSSLILINLQNVSARHLVYTSDYCVTGDQYKSFLLSHGSTYERDRTCTSRDRYCEIFTHLDGWDVQLTVSKDLYSQPEKICGVVKNFLNAHTISRDDLRKKY